MTLPTLSETNVEVTQDAGRMEFGCRGRMGRQGRGISEVRVLGMVQGEARGFGARLSRGLCSEKGLLPPFQGAISLALSTS